MEANQLQQVIEKGFTELRAELDQRFGSLGAELNEKFGTIDRRFEKIDGQLSELRGDMKKVADVAHLAHVSIEALRHDLSILDEAESAPLETRVSALEVRVTKLEKKRSPKK